MKRILAFILAATVSTISAMAGTTVLYNKTFNNSQEYPELVPTNAEPRYTEGGLLFDKTGGYVRLANYYSLGERSVRYHVKLSADADAIFLSHSGDFCTVLSMSEKKIAMRTNPIIDKKCEFLNPDHEYLVEVGHEYQTSSVSVMDLVSGDSATISATMDSGGGCGAGSLQTGFYVGLQHDYYCFGLEKGTSMLVKQMSVVTPECDLTLLIYGDSITEPEGYFPTADYPNAWTQLIMHNVKGKSIASGRGGTTINELHERIRHELPYLKAKYVMVTIGTNGGNTEENLSSLVEYIQSQGAIPILNNIPSNEHSTQIPVNEQIEKVRQKYNIKGCKFDIPTSLAYDGKQVDTSTMWFEDYGANNHYFHHPNVKGSKLLYFRTLIDVPEIYE